MSEFWKKNQKVLTFKDEGGVPSQILKIDNKELLPYSLQRDCTMENFKIWLNKRNIPENRDGYQEAVDDFGDAWLQNKNYASLSDQYWIKMRDEKWKKINFFTNLYSRDIGDIMFTPWTAKKKKYNTFSPDLTTNGVLKKRWIQDKNMNSYLLKAGNRELQQEPLHEVLVSVLLEQLNIIPYVQYDLCVEGVTLCSKCKNFITEDTELIPAYEIYYDTPRRENEMVYDHLMEMCDKFEVPGARQFINGIIFVDRMTGNEDRHLGNIGFIKDVNTNKFLGPAPLFDSGNAYWDISKISGKLKSKSKLFGNVEDQVFKNVFKNCNIEVLMEKENMERLEHYIMNYPNMSQERREALLKAIKKRNRQLCRPEQELDR